MRLTDALQLIFRSLYQRGLRSWLTVIGILIGVAALVSLVSITEGMGVSIEEELQVAGGDIIRVTPGKTGFGGGPGPPGEMGGGGKLNERDVEEIERVRGVEVVSPHLEGSVSVQYGEDKAFLSVIGIVPEDQRKVETADVLDGRYLTHRDRYSAVLGFDVANEVFDERVHVRKIIRIGKGEFRVRGILERTGGMFGEADRTIYIPYDTARSILTGLEEVEVSSIYVKASPGYDVEEVASRIRKRLLDFHNVGEDERDFTVISPELMSDMVSSVMGIVTLVMMGIASIALVVGGIGIMNTMLVSVVERTREIGIMKALGATSNDVLLLFVAESGFLGLAGGALGVVLGIGLSKVVGMVGHFMIGEAFPSVITPKIVGEGLAFALVVGTLSGLYPARKASSLDPVEALRYE